MKYEETVVKKLKSNFSKRQTYNYCKIIDTSHTGRDDSIVLNTDRYAIGDAELTVHLNTGEDDCFESKQVWVEQSTELC